MFNAVFKDTNAVPDRVMLGALLFVFSQFQPDTRVLFNQRSGVATSVGPPSRDFQELKESTRLRTGAETGEGEIENWGDGRRIA